LDNGELALDRFTGRTIPRVSIDEKPQFSCTIESAGGAVAGYDYLVRFFANGSNNQARGPEWVLCPSPNPGTLQVAELQSGSTDFVERPLSYFDGTLVGAIIGS
jgi:hypothetical protein